MGSPRKKGNTYRVVERVREKLMDINGEIDFEFLFLPDCELRSCAGCFQCIAKGEERCPLKDDRDPIMMKMLQADGIIFAAPCYAMGVPAIMKNFIDRFAYTLHRPLFFDKAFMAVATVGGVMGLKQTLDQMAILAAGSRPAVRLSVSCPPVPMPMIDKSTERRIRKATVAFYRLLAVPRRRVPGLGDWAYFHSFKAFTGFSTYRKACPADCAYYTDKQEYFYALHDHPLGRLLGRIFKVLMKAGLRLSIREDRAVQGFHDKSDAPEQSS